MRMSPDEVKRQYLQAMGPSRGPLYHDLWNEVAWLHAKWQQYVTLFAGARADVDVLNKTAGFFFRIVQGVLWEDTLPHLARLVDPPESLKQADKANVTLLALPPLIDDPALASTVRMLVDEVKARCAFAVDARNRHIAHRDLALALKYPTAKPLARGNGASVNEALESIREVFGAVHQRYLGTEPPGFQRFDSPPAADALLDHLRCALRRGER